MSQLTKEEEEALRSQIGISKPGRGGRRYLPYVFTEQGVAMLSSVLNSKQAIQVNIAIMDAFVRLRQVLLSHEELARRLTTLEGQYTEQNTQIQAVFGAIRELMNPDLSEDTEDPSPVRRIGFHREE